MSRNSTIKNAANGKPQQNNDDNKYFELFYNSEC